MRISDWSSDVCSSDLIGVARADILIAVATHRSSAARIETPRRRDRVARRAQDRPQPHPPGEHDAIGNGLIRARVHLRAGIAERQIGRASCRERVCQYVEISVVAVSLKKKNYVSY